MRYEIRRNGSWESKMTTFKVAKLLLFMTLLLERRLPYADVLRNQEKTKQEQTRRHFYGFSANYGIRHKSALNGL